MAYTAISCLDLRAGIARALNMPFQSLFLSGQSTITAGTNTYSDPNLTQDNNYWKHQWLFIPSLGHVARITGNTGGTLSVDRFVSFSGSREYEIFQIFSPVDLLWGINQAIQSSYPYYYDKYVFDNYAFGVSKYPLNVLSPVPAGVRIVLLEMPKQPYRVTPTNVTYNAGTVTITGDFSPVPPVGWQVTLTPKEWGGIPFTGKITSANSTTLTLNIPTTLASVLTFGIPYQVIYYNPAITAQFAYSYVKLNRDEFPDELYLDVDPNLIGYKMSIVYTTIPQPIGFNDTTIVPAGYIIPKAVSLLASSKMTDTRIDTRRWQALVEIHSQQAELFKQRYPFREGAGDLFINASYPIHLDHNTNNPLGW